VEGTPFRKWFFIPPLWNPADEEYMLCKFHVGGIGPKLGAKRQMSRYGYISEASGLMKWLNKHLKEQQREKAHLPGRG